MALSDYDITFSFPEISSIAEDRENSAYDDHADSGENYILSAPSSPESERLVPVMSVNKLMKHTLVTNDQEDCECNSSATHPSSFGQKRKPQKKKQNEPNGKNISRKRTKGGHANYVQSKTNPKTQTTSKMKRSAIENSRSKVSKTSRIKGEHENLDTESKLFVPALKPSKCQTQGSIRTKTNSNLNATPVTSVTAASTTSTLLSMIALAVSSPQYTSSHTCVSSTASDYPACPTRNSWPLLREMIAKPAGTVVSISPAPRQSLSTVKVETVNEEEPKARVASKLGKEIKCECKFNKGEPCWFLFQEDQLRKERLHHLTLKRESLDLVILAKIAANINREEKTKKCHGRDRQRCRVCYYHEGRQICRETFMFIHGICKGRLCALMQHYKKKGLSTRTHGNKANIPHHALSDKDSERVLDFIQDYANSHCLSTFGRKPGSKAGGGLLIMSTAQSKLYVHHKYKLWCSENQHRAVSLRSFQNLWTKHLPYIVVLRGSNKTPVPGPELLPNVLDIPEDVDFVDETGPEVIIEKTFHLLGRSLSMITDDTLKKAEVQADGSKQGHCDSSTQADFDCVKEGKLNRKRKSLPPRKVDLVSCLPEDTNGDFEHNQIFNEPHIMHSFISSSDTDIQLGCPDSVIDNSNEVNVIQDPLPQIDLQNVFFNGEEHVPQTRSSASLLSHPPVAMNFGHCQAAVILPPEKDIICTLSNKSSTSVAKTTSLQPSLGLPQPSELLDTYSMQCCDRFAPEVSDSHSLCDQSQSVFLSHQGLDLSNIHQLEWQTWPSYSAL